MFLHNCRKSLGSWGQKIPLSPMFSPSAWMSNKGKMSLIISKQKQKKKALCNLAKSKPLTAKHTFANKTLLLVLENVSTLHIQMRSGNTEAFCKEPRSLPRLQKISWAKKVWAGYKHRALRAHNGTVLLLLSSSPLPSLGAGDY